MPHAPHGTCARLVTAQQAHHLAHGPRLAFGATLAALALNHGGIDPMVGEPWGLSKARPPAACSTGCRATDHGGGFRQTQAPLGLGDFVEQARLVTGGDRARTRLGTRPRGAAELPGLFTQCKRHNQDTLWDGSMRIVGRCGQHGFRLHRET
jgi:hypothetical protein